MKTQLYSFFAMLILLIGCSSSQSAVSNNSKWVKLGQRTVNYGIDKDEIAVTFRDGRFNAIKLHLKGGPLNMHRCIIHFANGDTQNVNLKKNYRAGDETRVIDLEGRNRIISKVVFWYDTKNIAIRKSSVVLWGRSA